MSVKQSVLALSFLSVFASFEASAAPLTVECVLKGSCIETNNVMEHLKELQKIASANEGNRSAGTSGHELSGNYVAQKLLSAGYKVELQPFSFNKFSKHSGGFAQTSPEAANYEEDKDFLVMSYSGSGSPLAKVTAVDIALGAGNTSNSGCEGEDFTNFPMGNIALIQRGTCNFAAKVDNAQKAGAAAVIIFNQGNSPDREAIFNGTVSEEIAITIPVIATSYPFAVGLLDKPELTLSIDVKTSVEKKTSFNVIAETKTGNADNIIMIGAHLDSVAEGPGINDNGSGSAAILEVALKMKNIKPTNKVRFAWFSAEELGLIGSTRYVESLSEAEKLKIALMINIDMIGSTNYKLAVYDGDGSKFGLKGPEGSANIEQKFQNFFSMIGVESVETEMNGRSDYAAFAAAGIAVGGLFTGAEGVKTDEEAKLFGGAVGAAYDACYHKACDSVDNINLDALEMNTNAVGYILLSYADSAAEVRKAEKFAVNKKRKAVVYAKHLHCHEDVFEE